MIDKIDGPYMAKHILEYMKDNHVDISALNIDENSNKYSLSEKVDIMQRKLETIKVVEDMFNNMKDNFPIIKSNIAKKEHYSTKSSVYKTRIKNKQVIDDEKNRQEKEKLNKFGNMKDFMKSDCDICKDFFGKKPDQVCSMRGSQAYEECHRIFTMDEDIQKQYNAVWNKTEHKFEKLGG